MNYKRIKKTVPYCKKCNREITGDGSMISPYRCNCGVYIYDNNRKDYILKKQL